MGQYGTIEDEWPPSIIKWVSLQLTYFAYSGNTPISFTISRQRAVSFVRKAPTA